MNRRIGRLWIDQSGVALVSAMLAIFILTIVVAALVLATMGESGLSFDQNRSGQAFHLAEAGAYRALAELRRRIAVDLNARVAGEIAGTLNGRCVSKQWWRVIADYAYPTTLPSTDWANEMANRRAVLRLGTSASPVQVRNPATGVLGSFYATIYVRAVGNSPGPPPASACDNTRERFQMRFDYFIVATGATRSAQRTVCLKNPGNLANCGEWVASSDPGNPSWDSPPPSHGWLVLIERASYSQWALMMLNSSNTWLVNTSVFQGPVHTNDRFRIWGNPTFFSTVTQRQSTVQFGSTATPIADDNYCPPAHPGGTDCPVYNGPRMQRGAPRMDPPAGASPFWAVLDDPAGTGVPPNDAIRGRTTELANNGAPVPPGIYFMDECGGFTCGGLFVEGDAKNMVLCVSGDPSPPCPPGPGGSGRQHIVIIAEGPPVEQKMFVLDPGGVLECSGPPAYATCVNRGKGFNGMIFVNGSILASAGNFNSGLFGKVQQNTRLTIAADGAIEITDHLVYQFQPRLDPLDPLQNVLGIYAWCSTPPTCPDRTVTVDGSLASNDLHVYASVLAPWGKFWVAGWDTLTDKGTLTFIGGTVQADFGEFGGFLTNASGNIIGVSGYGRQMIYDQRFLANNAPPFFPLTNVFAAPRYPNPLVTPDFLYDRPLWEELTGQ